MHEAGLARGVAKSLRERGLRVTEVRLAVRGGHHDPASFDAELRTYLSEALPAEAAAVLALEIRRAPFGHLCLTCGEEFDAPGIEETCPRCGAASLPAITDEEIEIEPLDALAPETVEPPAPTEPAR